MPGLMSPTTLAAGLGPRLRLWECLNFWGLAATGEFNSSALNSMQPQARCLAVRGCAHWSYYLGAGSCYLQANDAQPASMPWVSGARGFLASGPVQGSRSHLDA